ncbi:MAG: GNAT family protein [bacterium]
MIKIRKYLEKDIPYRVKWLSNPNVNKFIGNEMGQKTNLQKEKEWFANYKKVNNKMFFTICDNSKPIGLMGLSNINKSNKNADLFIAIGEDDYRGKGIGKIAMEWIIDYGFTKQKLHKINLGVIKGNIPAVNLYKSLGFIIEGEMKDEVFYKGKFHNFLSMAIFNRNKNKNNKE